MDSDTLEPTVTIESEVIDIVPHDIIEELLTLAIDLGVSITIHAHKAEDAQS